jgi:hypothetical protein
VASCFTRPPAPHMPIFRSRTIGKPGPSAASGFGAGCAGAITKRRGRRRARRRSAQRSISWKCAQFDGLERAVYMRTAEHAGRIYLDLADEYWRAAEIGPDGWRVIGSPPVRFRRPAGMLSLPVPEPGGSIEALASLLNLPSRNDFVLIVAWLLAALRAGGPYPLLAISGEQGSAKSPPQTAQGAARPQCSPGAGALARTTRADDRGQQQLSARLR